MLSYLETKIPNPDFF